MGAYLFGSAAVSEMRTDSDLDVAVLQDSALNPAQVLKLKEFASMELRRDIDVVDLIRADTVTAAQVVSTGIAILSCVPLKMAEFETRAYSSYALLNEERAEILKDIETTGTIHG